MGDGRRESLHSGILYQSVIHCRKRIKQDKEGFYGNNGDF